jgi:hypothetical protein
MILLPMMDDTPMTVSALRCGRRYPTAQGGMTCIAHPPRWLCTTPSIMLIQWGWFAVRRTSYVY